MTPIPTDDAIGFFLAQMATKGSDRDRVELFQNAVIEAGGDFTLPDADACRPSHLVEVQLFGIHDAGRTADEAVANWIATAAAHLARRRETGASERVVLTDRTGIAPDDLRAHIERVRLFSTDPNAIAAARRLGMMLDGGMVA